VVDLCSKLPFAAKEYVMVSEVADVSLVATYVAHSCTVPSGTVHEDIPLKPPFPAEKVRVPPPLVYTVAHTLGDNWPATTSFRTV
jgi:hypothetical protein